MNKKLIILIFFFCFYSMTAVFAEIASDSASNPFDEGDVTLKDTVASLTTIADVKVAKASGITEIKEGYPKEGTLSGFGSAFLRLRSWPWGNVIGRYYQGKKVKVLGESGEFYLVEVDGKQGYMHRNYVSTEDKKASGVEPNYPGDTKSGGFLSLTDGVQASKDGASGKKPVATPADSSNSGKVTASNGKIVLNVPQQCQHNVKCPTPATACGPTALSMAMAYYTGENVSSLATRMYTATKCSSCGSNYDGLLNAAKNNGFPNAKWNGGCSQSWVREKLKQGTPLVAHVVNHFVVIKGIDNNGNVILNEPALANVEKTMTWTAFSSWWQSKCCLTLK